VADTYDITLRFECHEPVLAAAVVHEIVVLLGPAPDGTALVQNPRVIAAESIGGSAGTVVIRDARELDLVFRCAGTSVRDRAYHFVHSACRIGAEEQGS
jgi:hypothetical protein